MSDVSTRRRRGMTGPHLKVYTGAGVVALLLLASVVAPLPYDPESTDSNAILLPPSGSHWFGTDAVGADVFSRTIRAARVDLSLALGGTLLALVVGVSLGIWFSTLRRLGERMMRVLDGFQSLPLLILVLALVSMSGNKLWMIVVAIGIYAGPVYIRLVRSQIIVLRESRFIEAARANGASQLRIMRRHLLPNIMHVIEFQTGVVASGALLAIAALSFLGMGAQPPTASWGSMIAGGESSLVNGEWWPVVAPGAAIFLCIVCFNLVGDGLRALREDA
jgi:peptide/nickel transport system permease protein